MKDFELQLRIRNNRLKARRLALGLKPQELAEKAGVSYPKYLDLESLRASPLCRDRVLDSDGKRRWSGSLVWTTTATRIAAFFRVPPDELWPAAVLAVKKTTITTEVDAETLLLAASASHAPALPAPDEVYDQQERREQLSWFVDRLLNDQEKTVITGLFVEERTMEDIGGELQLSRGRIHQIQGKALRRLRSDHVFRRVMAHDPRYAHLIPDLRTTDEEPCPTTAPHRP